MKIMFCLLKSSTSFRKFFHQVFAVHSGENVILMEERQRVVQMVKVVNIVNMMVRKFSVNLLFKMSSTRQVLLELAWNRI